MHWNYRVVACDVPGSPGDHWFDLRELYYDDDGGIVGWCPVELSGYDDRDDLVEHIRTLLRVVDTYVEPLHESALPVDSHLREERGLDVDAKEHL